MPTNSAVHRPAPLSRAPSAPELQQGQGAARANGPAKAAGTGDAPIAPTAIDEAFGTSLPLAVCGQQHAGPAPASTLASAATSAAMEPSQAMSLRAGLRRRPNRLSSVSQRYGRAEALPSVLQPAKASQAAAGRSFAGVPPHYTSVAPAKAVAGRAPPTFAPGFAEHAAQARAMLAAGARHASAAQADRASSASHSFGQSWALPPLPGRKLGKHKPLSALTQAAYGLTGRYSVLGSADASYCFAPASARGSYGKIHLAINAAAPDAQLALKALRMRPKSGTDRIFGDSKTAAQSKEAIVTEYAVHRRVRESVNLLAPPLRLALLGNDVQTLRSFVSEDEPSWVYDLVFDAGHTDKAGEPSPKAYIVSTFVPGTAHGMLQHLRHHSAFFQDKGLRRMLARSFLFQTFTELHLMHTHVSQGHFDLTLGNVHVNAHGNFQLADFGFSLPLHAGLRAQARGHRGSIAVPEMIAMGRGNTCPELSNKADVMVLWLLGLQLLAGGGQRMPFYWMRADDAGKNTYDALNVTYNLSALHGVRQAVLGLPRGAESLERDAQGAPVLPSSGNKEVDRFLGRAAAADWTLFHLALCIGLNFDPTERLDAGEQACYLAALMLETSAEERSRMRTFSAAYAQDPGRDATHRELVRFNALREAQQAAQLQDEPGGRTPVAHAMARAVAHSLRPGATPSPARGRSRSRALVGVQARELRSVSAYASPQVSVG